jgi:dTDP-4-dehydrorhamnose 3,5-epimerase
MLLSASLPLKDAKLFTLKQLKDNRGWFVETYRKSWIEQEIDQHMNFTFDYTSFNSHANTVRGMHAQNHIQPQSKLVSVLHGSIQDVIIDARKDSPTFGQHWSIMLNDIIPQVLYVPAGFYHGFKTLQANTLVHYKLDNYHNAEAECGVMFDDKDLNIDWLLKLQDDLIISERDKKHPSWNDAYKF